MLQCTSPDFTICETYAGRRDEGVDTRVRLHGDRGITLIEVVVAMSLLVIASLFLLPVVANSVTQSDRDQRIAIAGDIANEAIDSIRTSTSVGSTCAVLNGYVTSSPIDQIVLDHPEFTKRIAVTCPTVTAPAGMGLVVITVKDVRGIVPSELITVSTLVNVS